MISLIVSALALQSVPAIGQDLGPEIADVAQLSAEIHFPDPNLKAAVEATLGVVDPSVSDMLDLEVLVANRLGISELAGLEHAVNLEALWLEYNRIEDLSALSQLEGLSVLRLKHNRIRDISAIAGLIELTDAEFSANPISNIDALAGLTKLRILQLGSTQIRDINALSELPALEKLSIGANSDLQDVSILPSLARLKLLSLAFNRNIESLEVLSQLTHLESLDLQSVTSDITPLKHMLSLTYLNLKGNQITDIAVLAELTNLTVLSLSDNEVSDITALTGLVRLERLYLDRNDIQDISALTSLQALRRLDLRENPLDEDGLNTRLERIRVNNPGITILDLFTIYVDDDAPLHGDGSSWARAYKCLQDGLATADTRAKPIQIRVAQGFYFPDRSDAFPEGTGDRNTSFQLMNGVSLEGGYAGLGATFPDDRDIEIYRTILTGDLHEHDGPRPNNSRSEDNVFHVVNGSHTDSSAVLDGVTIRDGFADGGDGDRNDPNESRSQGAGMYNQHGRPTLIDCVFTLNYARWRGSGVYNDEADPTFIRCRIVDHDGRDGAGMYNSSSSPLLVHCHFEKNLVYGVGYGGGMYNAEGSAPRLTNCTFLRNSSYDGRAGGGIFNDQSVLTLVNCLFQENVAVREHQGRGGAVYLRNQSNAAIVNCLFIGNSARHSGGALYIRRNCIVDVINCTFFDNIAGRGSAIACDPWMVLHPSHVKLANCILWNRGEELWNQDGVTELSISHSNLKGGADAVPSTGWNMVWGDGNMDMEPGLTPDGHLRADSPCIDAGDDAAVIVEANLDFDGDVRFVDCPDVDHGDFGLDSVVDMGADEFSDSDGDHLPDWWEQQHFLDPLVADPIGDPDHDRLANLEEYELYSSLPHAPAFYVDTEIGDDAYAGLWPFQYANVGPKRTIQAALDLAGDGDTVLIAPGIYQGAGNMNLDFGGKDIVLYAPEGPEHTVIDCEQSGRAFDFHAGESWFGFMGSNPGAAIVGFAVTNGRANGGGAVRVESSSPQLRNCVFEGNASALEPQRLTFNRGYDFSQQKVCEVAAGDFYYWRGNREDMGQGRYGEYQFAADFPDWGQRGIIDLGPVALAEIAFIPTEGYQMENVVAVEGHSYVALAQEKEKDFCILFQVVSVSNPTVTIDWLYVDRNAWPDYTPPGGAIYCHAGYPVLDNCSFIGNAPDGLFIQDSDVQVEGVVRLVSNDMIGEGIFLAGEGTLQLRPEVTLHLTGSRSSRIRCNVRGPGKIRVDQNSDLILEGRADIDLSGREASGLVQCDGLLHLRGSAILTHADINVTRAQFEGKAKISNSVITAESGASQGQLFIEDTVEIANNRIYADGDRYMDLDPSVFDGIIANNLIHVTVTEGVGSTRGGLLELRAPDFYTRGPPGNSIFLHKIPTVPDFNDTSWTIDRLELVEGAKINLTNRFDFGHGSFAEVMYVRELALGPDSVFNSGLQTLYYQDLVLLNAQGQEIERNPDLTQLLVNGAQYKNIPLLGFSLYNIALDDDDEFATRVVHNNAGSIRDSVFSPPLVERVSDLAPDPNGMMRMRNLLEQDPHSVMPEETIHARAKGLFGRCSEGLILVQFEYLFESDDPGTELIVYLSDVPGLQYRHRMSPPDPNHLEVGRIRPPYRGRPGSVGSGRFAVFHTYTPRHHLNFIKGTRIELELMGAEGTSVLINNWDPQVHCGTPCMDLDGTGVEDNFDLMVVLGESGKSTELGTGGDTGYECVDGLLSCNGYADLQDLISMEWTLDRKPGNLYPAADRKGRGLPLVNPDMVSSSSPLSGLNTEGGYGFSSALLILGQGQWNIDASANLGTEYVYGLNHPGQYTSTHDFGHESNCHARLIPGDGGAVYSVSAKQGILQLHDDGSSHVLLSPGQHDSIGQGDVYMGVHSDGFAATGRPIWDAVVTQDFIYVVPIVLVPPAAAEDMKPPPYLAAAKLSRAGRVEMIYDDPGFRDPVAPDNPHLGGLREIEVDAAGRVYVLNAHRRNLSDALWQYRADGHVNWRIELGDPSKPRYVSDLAFIEDSGRPVYVPNPTGLCVSYETGKVYLASGLRHEQDHNRSYVYGFSTADGGLQRMITIYDMQIVTDITEDPDTGTLWVVGYNLDAHALAADSYLDISESFYQARLVSIPNTETVVREVTAHALEPSDENRDHDLVLPLSIMWNADADPG